MSITPNGLPPWGRTTDIAQYGGNVDKANYQSQGSINPRTDIDVAEFARLTADLAALARTAFFCELEIVMNSAGDPTVNWVEMMTDDTVDSYVGTNPPAGFPTVLTLGVGHVQVVFDASYADAYGVEGAISIKGCLPSRADGSAGFCGGERLALSVGVRCYDVAGNPEDGTVNVVIAA